MWNEKVLKRPEIFQARGYEKRGIGALFFEGIPYRGNKTRVFAYVGIPEVVNGNKLPGIVLVHGGGGTAFADWVEIWNNRGYAAIAMDLEGHVPDEMKNKSVADQYWESHNWSGPSRKFYCFIIHEELEIA